MRRRMYGVFNSVDDAKNALGLIKKQSWNQAELMVIMQTADTNRSKENKAYYEMADEHFLADNRPGNEWQINQIWPGLQEIELAGIGTVRVGYSMKTEENNKMVLDQELNSTDLKVVEREIAAQKIVARFEVEEQFLPKLRLIMVTSGGELIEDEDVQ